MNSRLWFWILLFWLVLGTVLSWYFLCCHGSCKSSCSSSAPNGKLSLGQWIIQDEPNFKATTDHLMFAKNGGNFLLPLAAGVDSAFIKTAAYLKGNANRQLNITGLYRYDEVNPDSSFPNLGLSRANAVKNYLVKLGALPKQFKLNGQLLDSDWFMGDTLAKGVYFNFSALEETPSPTPNVGKENMSMSIYFRTNQSSSQLTSFEKSQLDALLATFNRQPNSSLMVYGHTDNRGSKAMNDNLSNARASFAKDVLTKNGISADKMEVKGFGYDRPAADNETAFGRARNRRVDITLK